ncbi:MAG: PilN domain-containing protein [Candidatus Omnitrophica bacterium]|nr:PilN domain-containing protein [Candidatus Omnitrophota bacterium]
MVSSFRIIDTFEDGYANVLLATVPIASVQRILDIFQTAGLVHIEGVCLGCETLLLWHTLAATSVAKSSLLLANVDTHQMNIDIIHQGKLAFTRGIPSNTGHPLTKEKIVEELKVSLDAYQKETHNTVERMALTGCGDILKTCEDAVSHAFAFPVTVTGQLEHVAVKESASKDSFDTSFVELLGLALNFQDTQINLLPGDMFLKNRLKQIKSHVSLTLALVGLMTLLGIGLAFKKLNDKTAYLAYLKTEIASMDSQVAQTKKTLKYLTVLKEQMLEKPLAIDFISEIYKLSPSGITLNGMDYEDGKTLTLKGTASSLSEALKYVAILEGSQYFQDVKIKNAVQQKGGGSEYAAFEILCALSREGHDAVKKSE